MAWHEEKDGGIILTIQARPGASRNEILGEFDGALRIKVKAPAVEGAANKELVKFLAKTFKCAKSEVRFVSGETSKSKRVWLPRTEGLEGFLSTSS